ncbi:MAG TPA: hypothetical protein VD908_01370 [Cytophagales bacterium]|nr:hypothetical protein [Cytophagales bacterium]
MNKILFVLFLLINTVVYSQQRATTSDRRVVILNENGTWKFEEEIVEPTTISFTPEGKCDFWVTSKSDKVEGIDYKINRETIFFSNNFKNKNVGIGIVNSNGKINLKFYLSKGCLEEKSRIVFLFEDSTRLELTTSNKANCKGNASISLNDKSIINDLITKEINIVRIYTKDGFIEQSPSLKEQGQFSNLLYCISAK